MYYQLMEKRQAQLIQAAASLVRDLDPNCRIGMLSLQVNEMGRPMPMPDEDEHGAEPLICQEEDQEMGFSVFINAEDESKVAIPLLIYDEEKFRREFLEPVRNDEEFDYLTGWFLDMDTLNPPKN